MGGARHGMLGFGYEMPSLRVGSEGATCLYNSSMQEAETEKSAQGHPDYIKSLRSAWATRERNECEKGARKRKGGRGRKKGKSKEEISLQRNILRWHDFREVIQSFGV